MAFPIDPSDNDTYTNALGTQYVYSAARGAWIIRSEDIGLTGVQGVTGLPGPAGVNGATGVAGPAGAAGAPGVTGLSGVGVTGLSGVTGPAGVGSAGATGVAGPAGATGAQGVTGASGSSGSVTYHAYMCTTDSPGASTIIVHPGLGVNATITKVTWVSNGGSGNATLYNGTNAIGGVNLVSCSQTSASYTPSSNTSWNANTVLKFKSDSGSHTFASIDVSYTL